MHPLIAEKSLVFSPALAATIGLEEAVLLAWLNDVSLLQGGARYQLNNDQLRQALPFWDDQKIRLVVRNLHEKGLIQLLGGLFPDSPELNFSFPKASLPRHQSDLASSDVAFSERTPAGMQNTAPQRRSSNQPMQQQWQPSRDALGRLQQHGIPDSYSLSQLDAFILQAQETGNNRNDWNTQFFRYIKKYWVYTQTDAHKKQRNLAEKAAFNTSAPDRQQRFAAQREEASPMAQRWEPSLDAQQILQRAGIASDFIQESIPEFVLYWQERGDAHKTWNTKFIQHVRQQWARYSSSLEHSSLPTRILDDWQPANDCYDILSMAHIDLEFAQGLIKEFVLYWRDSNQLQASWNSKFLQYVKQQWARYNQSGQTGQHHGGNSNAGSQHTTEPGYTTAEASRQRLNDTDW